MKIIEKSARHLITKFELPISSTTVKKEAFTLNYERRSYRDSELTKLILKSVPFFALTESEFAQIKEDEISELYTRSWPRISKAIKSKKGDYGEIILFLLLKFFYNNERIVTKIRLKSSNFEQVKGYDCANFTIEDNQVTLWLGEAKFYKEFSRAVSDVVEEIVRHTNTRYLKEEMKILYTNCEINKDSPHKQLVDDVISGRISLDKVKIKIPALITYNSAFLKNHSDIDTEEFQAEALKQFKARFRTIDDHIKGKIEKLNVVFILLPLCDVDKMKSELNTVEQAMRFIE